MRLAATCMLLAFLAVGCQSPESADGPGDTERQAAFDALPVHEPELVLVLPGKSTRLLLFDSLRFAADGRTAFWVEDFRAYEDVGSRVRQLDLTTGQLSEPIFESPEWFVATCFSLDGRFLFVTDEHRVVKWDVAERRAAKTIEAPAFPDPKIWCATGYRLSACMSDDGRTLFTHFIYTLAWDLESGRVELLPGKDERTVELPGVKPDVPRSDLMVHPVESSDTSDRRPMVHVETAAAGNRSGFTFMAPMQSDALRGDESTFIHGPAFSTDRQRLFFAAADPSNRMCIKVWDLNTGQIETVALAPPDLYAGALAVSRDDRFIFAASKTGEHDKLIYAFNMSNDQWVGRFMVPGKFHLFQLWVTPDDRHFVAMGIVDAPSSASRVKVLHYDLAPLRQ